MGKWSISIFLTVSCLIISVISYSQDYQALKSSGTLPDDFVSLMSEKYVADAVKINKNERWQSRKIQKQFYLESNYSINEIFKSGNVLFNDEISIYLRKIYSKIQDANPELKHENIRFYTSRSTIVNAFAMHSGVIFINIGLMAKVETEDALAYIMCHEISHYLKKHNIKQYTYNVEVEKKGNIFKSIDWEDKMFSKANYSQQQELEADSIGLAIFSKTDYSIWGAESALKCLETYNLPFKHNLNFSGAIFESDYFRLDSLAYVDVKDLKESEREQSEYSTHPEINVRIDSIKSYQKQMHGEDDASFTGNTMQKTAQYELCHLYLEKGMDYHAIYCTLDLLNDDPSNDYLQRIFKNAIYSLAKSESFNEYLTEENDVFDFETKRNEYYDNLKYSSVEIQKIWKFLSRIKRKELNFIAIDQLVRWAEKNSLDSPGMGYQEWDQRRIEDLLADYFMQYSFKAKEINPSMNYLHENYSAFAKIYDTSLQKFIRENPSEDEESDNEDRIPKKKSKSKKKELQIPKLIVMDLQYHILDLRKENSYKFMASEDALLKYEDKIKENSKIAGLDCVFISPISVKSNEVETLNDIMLLKSFLNEEFNNSPEAINSNKEAINEIIRKYNTNKLALMGTYSARINKSLGNKMAYLAVSAFFFPLIPGSLKYALYPEYQTYSYILVFDLQAEKLIFNKSHLMKMSDNEGAINSAMYYNLLRVKKMQYEEL